MTELSTLIMHPPYERNIFTNRTLNMRSIRAIGYDMDYTLIQYRAAEWEALAYASRYGWKRIGGSDSHIVSHIGRCATRFDAEIRDMDDLVEALRGCDYDAIVPESGA